MKGILSRLYCGEYAGCAHPFSENPELEAAWQEMEALEKELKEMLPDEIKAKFRAYIHACAKVQFEAGEEDFSAGFRLGVQLMEARFRQQ